MYPYVLIKMVGPLRLSGHELFEMSVPCAVNETAMPQNLLALGFLRRDFYRSERAFLSAFPNRFSKSFFSCVHLE